MNFVQKQFYKSKDVNFTESGTETEINLSLGSDYYWNLITRRVVKSKVEGGLVAFETKCSSGLSGVVALEGKSHSVDFVISSIDGVSFEGIMFWELESLWISSTGISNY